MACVPIPVIPQPVLPFPFSLAPPPLPDLPFELGICCQVVAFSTVPPPLPLPPFIVNPAFVAALHQAIGVAQAYLDAIPLQCPKELGPDAPFAP